MANMEQEKEKMKKPVKKVVQTTLEAERQSAGSRYYTTHGC
ncbi:MAG: hypothetical protein ACLRL6_00230 [Clostridium sp.]